MTKQWANKDELNFGKIDKKAINAMKGELLKVEAEMKDMQFPSKLTPWEDHNRTEILSAGGTVATFNEARLSNPAYVETLKADITLITDKTPADATKPDRFAVAYKQKVAHNPVIQEGLKELSALIAHKEEPALNGR